MSTTAFTSDGIRVSSNSSGGVTLSKAGENWGDPWPVPDEVLHVKSTISLIKALQAILENESNERW